MENVSLDTMTATPAATASAILGQVASDAQAKIQEEAANPPTEAKPETKTEEAPKEEKPPEPKESQRFAALAKKEKAVVREQMALKAEREKFQAERAEFEAWKKQQAEDAERWQKDPLGALNTRGWDYDKLTNWVLNQGKPTAEMQVQEVRAEIERLRKERDDAQAKSLEDAKQAAQAEHEKVLQAFREEVKGFVQTNQEKYELTNLYDPNGDIVLATIDQHFADTLARSKEDPDVTPEVMSIDKATELVEKYLEGLVEKATKTKKYQAKATPQPQADEKQSKTAPPRTLNNNLTPSATPPSETRLSREERIKRAMSVQVSRT